MKEIELVSVDSGHQRMWLARSDSQWHSYDKLPDDLKKECDAFETFLMHLAVDKYLYLVGSFVHTPDAARNFVAEWHKTLILRRKTGSWSGVWGPCLSKQELHSASNYSEKSPYAEDYLFVLVNKALSEDSLTKLTHVRPELKHISDACLGNLYCAIEDGPDRNYFELYCPEENVQEVRDVLKRTLAEFDMELKGQENRK